MGRNKFYRLHVTTFSQKRFGVGIDPGGFCSLGNAQNLSKNDFF